jgi:hypothetical protein
MFNFLINESFPVIVILFFFSVMYLLFSRKGKDIFVRMTFGKIIKDYGDMGSSTIYNFFTQTIHLYECSKDNIRFFVIETRMFMNVQYTKISPETAKNLINAISSSRN